MLHARKKKQRRDGANKREGAFPMQRPYRKRSLAHFDSGITSKWMPFPAASVTTILLVALVASTLSALYIGAHRRRYDGVVLVARGTKIPTTTVVAVPSSSGEEDGIVGSATGGGLQTTDDVNGPSIRSLRDLTQAELHPEAGPRRHIVTPPRDTSPITLVTCSTTAGYLHVSYCSVGREPVRTTPCVYENVAQSFWDPKTPPLFFSSPLMIDD